MKHDKKTMEEAFNAEAGRSKRYKKKEKKKSKFGLFLLCWLAVLVVLGGLALNYVSRTLKSMQANAPAQFVAETLEKLSDEQLKEYFAIGSPYEADGGVANIRKFIKDGDYTLSKVPGKDAYNVHSGNNKVVTVALNKVKAVKALLIMSYNVYELGGIEKAGTGELYHYEVTAPSTCVVKVNGIEAKPDETVEISAFGDASKYVEVPSECKYVLGNLTQEPKIEITRNGEAVSFEMAENIVIENDSWKLESLASAGVDFDAMKFAESWSRFMTKDLAGSLYGFYNIDDYFIANSQQYSVARKWATSIDITFTSPHVLKNPPFTDEVVENAVKYNDNLYSVDVHLVKHMRLNNGANRDDALDNTVYIIRYNNEWKVVNMRSIAK